jgi:hypothetical protein
LRNQKGNVNWPINAKHPDPKFNRKTPTHIHALQENTAGAAMQPKSEEPDKRDALLALVNILIS